LVSLPLTLFSACLLIEDGKNGVGALFIDRFVWIVFVEMGAGRSFGEDFFKRASGLFKMRFTERHHFFVTELVETRLVGVEVRGYESFYQLGICMVDVSRS